MIRFRTWPAGAAFALGATGVLVAFALVLTLHYAYKAGRLLGPVADWIGGDSK